MDKVSRRAYILHSVRLRTVQPVECDARQHLFGSTSPFPYVYGESVPDASTCDGMVRRSTRTGRFNVTAN